MPFYIVFSKIVWTLVANVKNLFSLCIVPFLIKPAELKFTAFYFASQPLSFFVTEISV